MPLSTGSIDSGFFGGFSSSLKEKSHGLDEKTSLPLSSPLSMTDEDDILLETTSSGTSEFSEAAAVSISHVFSSSSIGATPFFVPGSSATIPRKTRTRVRRSYRKLKQRRFAEVPPFPSSISPTTSSSSPSSSPPSSSSSSCCVSVAGSSRSSSLPTQSIDDLAIRLYFYFKSLLIAVNRQKTICESIAYIVKDYDARWGNCGVRKKPCDPKGCLAPVYSSIRNNGPEERLVTPAKFPMCWAVPQPAIFYQLMAADALEYIKFLERVSPQVKTQHQPPGMPILNDREASITMEEMQKLHLQHQHQQQQQQQHFQMHRGATAVYQPYAFTPAMFPALPERQMKGPVLPTMMKIGGGEAAANGEKLIPHRDSSTTSRSSSRVDHEATKEDADKLDDCSMVEPPSCVDLDKTPCGTDETKVQKASTALAKCDPQQSCMEVKFSKTEVGNDKMSGSRNSMQLWSTPSVK
uniref:Uncharacterized protein n=1 Tax=Caenorhabditis japonica TaxID=281687 RepID=A0A8R1IEU7_CAEJA